MLQPDLILLHAPSVYDFRRKPILYGPISDVVPSTPIFEMYPIGFMTMLGHLQRHGYRVRIINVALQMVRNPRFDAEKLIRNLKPRAFGIDLHWLVHAHGSLALAELIKKYHPEIPVIFGGVSASYYHAELIRYPQVDYVLRGDSVEEPLRQLLVALKLGASLAHVPNLTWKDGEQIQINDLSHVPATLADMVFDYGSVMKATVRWFDFFGHLPFKAWLRYPIVCALSCRGCTYNCIICGGSASAYRGIANRSAPAFRSPTMLAHDIRLAAGHSHAPVIVLGDIVQAGETYALEFLQQLQQDRLENHIALEFFTPPSRRILEQIALTFSNFNIQISPESHDVAIRQRFGRPYDNADLERMLTDAREVGCQRLDVFFMIGLPGQTPQSVRDTLAYCRTLLDRFGRDPVGWLHPYISPLAPFLDPGSRAFEHPEQYGYRRLLTTLEEHRQALAAPAWLLTLNYETEWMTRADIAETTYVAALELNQIKMEYGLQDQRTTAAITERITAEQELLRKITEIIATVAPAEQEQVLHTLLSRYDLLKAQTLCHAREMQWPVHLLRVNPFRILQSLLSR